MIRLGIPIVVFALARRGVFTTLCLAAALASSACGSDDPPQAEHASVSEALTHEDVMNALERSGDWELAPNSVTIASPEQPFGDDAVDMYGSAGAEAAADGQADIWYAEDGERYEALFALPSGVVYGRRGPAPHAEPPGEDNNWAAPSHSTDDQGEPVRTKSEPLGIGLNWGDDRRNRISSSTALASYPVRVSGPLSGDGDTKSGACSATKIGPRALLTASHCVWNNDLQVLTTSGFWNPGQTNSSALNGSFNWSGVYFRNYANGTQYDYAIIFLPNTQPVFSLSWLGVQWWGSGSSYAGKSSFNHGYPCGPNNQCGTTLLQKCKDSALASKQCDGWMYSDPATLVSGDYLANNELSFDNDISGGHSGSAVYTSTSSGSYTILTLVSGALAGQKAKGPRFRQSMWNDVCSWIADPNYQSSWGNHSLCN